MSAMPAALFNNMPKTDPLQFWSNDDNKTNYRSVAKFLDFDKSELSRLGGVTKESARLEADRIPKILKERLEQIAITCTKVAEYFDGNVEKTALWFKTPNPELGNVSPRDMIRLGRFQKLQKFINESTER